jgi:hypothetical protein
VDLLQLIVLVAILGVVWWALTTQVPMPPAGKKALTIAFVVVIVLALLSFLGIGTSMLHYRPHLG